MSRLVRPVVLFDGACTLCNGAVQFIIKHDVAGKLSFASLQSKTGTELLLAHSRPELLGLKSIVFMQGAQIYTESTAILKIARCLRRPWPLLSGLVVVPRRLRDCIYRLVAHNRYRWFGKQEACWLPTPALRARFLLDG